MIQDQKQLAFLRKTNSRPLPRYLVVPPPRLGGRGSNAAVVGQVREGGLQRRLVPSGLDWAAGASPASVLLLPRSTFRVWERVLPTALSIHAPFALPEEISNWKANFPPLLP